MIPPSGGRFFAGLLICIQSFVYKLIIRLDRSVKPRARCRQRGPAKALNNKEKPMAHDEPQAAGPTKLVIRNIGLMLSGAMEKPILDADTIVAENGRITAIGRAKDVDADGATTTDDANSTTVAPGLIDSHVHPVAGDWTPRQNQIGWIDSFLHGGVTTMISAGEGSMPGPPRDLVGPQAN